MLSQRTRDIVKSTAPVLADHGTAITSVFYRNMFAAHPELLNIFNHTNQAQGRQQAALANTVYAAAVHIDNLENILPAVVQIAHKHVSLGVKAEHYPIVGEHLLKAIKEVLGEAATDDILGAWAEAYGVIADAFISVEANMYKESREQDNGWNFFKTFIVAQKIKESDTITSFYLKPADGSNVPEYKPGQYISIRVSIPGEKYMMIRQYSLSQAPRPDEFRISVKREADKDPNGVVSLYLHEQVQEGNTVEVSAPAGEFILDPAKTTPVAFLSGGVGITPMIGMLETVSTTTPDRPTVFLHAARNEALAAFQVEVEKHAANMSNVKYKTFFSDKPDGYISRKVLEEFVDTAGDVYVCGPVPFMESIIRELHEIGVKNEQIHHEFFGPAMQLDNK
ncbi:NO-inducible flavohemoprotein [Paenibacillus apii]|uniref:NO-inducible flavohemoprotein n=1 Tax=Paenibacillus apii TaxID=1850370 RepID=UPI00143B5039|nr:NO-inducible flavohemoprotein [Paenibacillus apii]NJJ38715.1 NO-inducible flavohemoprotein [Paenibacillus apii]